MLYVFFFFNDGSFAHTGVRTRAEPSSYDHTSMKAPYPIRTAKLSMLGPDQYFGRGLQGNLRCCMSFIFNDGSFAHTGVRTRAVPSSYDHTRVKAPHPIRTAKLSTLGPDQYFGRGLQGNLRCCMSFFPQMVLLHTRGFELVQAGCHSIILR